MKLLRAVEGVIRVLVDERLSISKRELRSIWNQAWFNSIRSASGLYRYAKRSNDKELLNKAILTKELALAFPQKQGFFPGLIATETEDVEIEGKIYPKCSCINLSINCPLFFL